MRFSMSVLIAFRSVAVAPGLYCRKVASVTPFMVAPPGFLLVNGKAALMLQHMRHRALELRSMISAPIVRRTKAAASRLRIAGGRVEGDGVAFTFPGKQTRIGLGGTVFGEH